jgi:ABC-2 type transport system permease protein
MSQKQMVAKYIKFIIYLLVIVLVNVAGLTLFFRLDLTENRIYSLSKSSLNVVDTLSEPLTINVFFTKNLPAPYNNIERYLHDLLSEYAIHSNKFFNFRFYNVSPEAEGATASADENQKLASNYGIRPVQIQAVEKDEIKFKKAYMGLVLIHGDMVERIPTITTVKGLEYRLTTAIQKLNNKTSALLSLKEKVQVKLVLSSSLLQVAPMMGIKEIQAYPEKLKQIVGTLNEKLYDRLEYTYVDPSKEKDAQQGLEKYELMELKWDRLAEKNIPAGEGTVGLIMTYGTKTREIPILKVIRIPIIGTQYNLADFTQVEESINDNLETLIDINENLGYLADHGTLSVSGRPPMGGQRPDGLSVFPTLISQNYSLKPVSLKTESIPESLQCLMIARPTENFSDYELYQIDQALMRGTNLAIFQDAFKEEMPTQQQMQMRQGPTIVPLNTGLRKLLSHYGVDMDPAIVMDEFCHKQMLPKQMGGGQTSIYYVPIIQNRNINKKLDFIRHLKGLIGIKMSPLSLNKDRIAKNKVDAQQLFASSEKSWLMRERINFNPMYLSPPGPDAELKRYPLAYLLEGEFPSFFAGKPMPEKPVDKPADKQKEDKKELESQSAAAKGRPEIEEKGGRLDKGKRAKILFLSSSEMLGDSVLDEEGKTPNALLILNAIDALNNREDIAVMRSKEQRFNPLGKISAFSKTLIKSFNVVGLPVIVVMFGLFLLWRRHARKKQIQMMFQN